MIERLKQLLSEEELSNIKAHAEKFGLTLEAYIQKISN